MTTTSVRRGIGHRPVDVPFADVAGRSPVPRPVRRVGYLLALAVWTLPLLTPAGPGNTAAADVTIGAAMVMTVLWLHRSGARVALPYSLGMGILMTAGLIAAVHHRAAYSGLTIVQDLFMLLWGASVANAIQNPWVLRVFLKAWCWSGIAWAAVLVFSWVAGFNAVAGVTAANGGRAALTFHDPNLAANYLLCAVMVLLATRAVRRPWIRFAAVGVILTAIFFTGSNGALFGLMLGFGVAAVIRIHQTRGPVTTVAVVALTVLLAGVAGPHVDLSAIREKAAGSVRLLADSVGRTDSSGSEREILLSEGLRLFRTGDLIGVAPGRTKHTLAEEGASYVKEAHNDYLGTLVERGLLGGIGLIILISAGGVRLTRVTFRPLPSDVAALVPRPEYLLGLGCALLASGFFYEVLHFRHLWAFLGLVAGLDLMVGRRWRR
jgi:O-antigen ligase